MQMLMHVRRWLVRSCFHVHACVNATACACLHVCTLPCALVCGIPKLLLPLLPSSIACVLALEWPR